MKLIEVDDDCALIIHDFMQVHDLMPSQVVRILTAAALDFWTEYGSPNLEEPSSGDSSIEGQVLYIENKGK